MVESEAPPKGGDGDSDQQRKCPRTRSIIDRGSEGENGRLSLRVNIPGGSCDNGILSKQSTRAQKLLGITIDTIAGNKVDLVACHVE